MASVEHSSAAPDEYDPSALPALPLAFFDRHPSQVAPDLLGRVLASTAGGVLTAGRIVETEAYLGQNDPGSHAATRGVTKRNAVMYESPGTVYVYFTYGNHHMLNLVCEPRGVAGAVLIRALEPLAGIDVMATRRGGRRFEHLCDGPGKLAAALGVDLSANATVLGAGPLSVYDGDRPSESDVATTGRVGLSDGYDLELRYYIATSPFVSRGRTGPPLRRRDEGADRRSPT